MNSAYYIYNRIIPLGGSVVKNPPASAGKAGDSGWTPGFGMIPLEEEMATFQYSCLENLMDRGAWWAIVYRVAKSQT